MDYRYSSRSGSLQQSDWSEDQVLDTLNEASPGNTSTNVADIAGPGGSVSRRIRPSFPDSEIRRRLRTVPKSLVCVLPASVLWEHRVVPIIFDQIEDTYYIVAQDADDIALMDKLSFLLAKNVVLVPGHADHIVQTLVRLNLKSASESADSMLSEFTDTSVSSRSADDDEFLSDVAPASERVRHSAKRSRAEFRRGPNPESNVRGYDLYSSNSTVRKTRGRGMLYYTIDDGERVLRTSLSGERDLLVGPRRVWIGRNRFEALTHHVAHPGQFLIVRFLDGSQQHLPGPAELWEDPRIHESISTEDCLQLAAREAVVVYSRKSEMPSETDRRLVHGPAMFTPQPGEWLHSFSWHASPGGHLGVQKIPNSLRFQKLWLMPDQMYHDVPDVRTSDNAVIVIRLMVFFELIHIERMLDSTRDPIGDFVNAATADVVEFTGRLSFEEFKQATGRLNDPGTYRTLLSRAEQIGYRVNNVVYRGYGAAESLQKMHDQAIEARTRLQLDRATEEQTQDLENYRLQSQLSRASMRRQEQSSEVQHAIEMDQKKRVADLEHAERQREFERRQREATDQQREAAMQRVNQIQQQHLVSLKQMGVDLTAYLTQNRADQVIELRGQATSPQLHLSSRSTEQSSPNAESEAD
ncbi:MAG: hypothetical protein R3C20_18265 [Planctomycetaceae bacterium]